MDEYIDRFLSSASWSELNTSSRSSWADTIAPQASGLLSASVEEYGEDDKNQPMCMIRSPHAMGNLAAEDLDPHAHGSNLKYLSKHDLEIQNPHSQLDSETHDRKFSLKDVFETNSTSGSFGRELNTSCSVTLPHSAITMSSSIESNGSEPSKFSQSLGDGNSISSVPSMWPPSFSGVSSFMEQGKLQDFVFQGVESDADELAKTYIENGTYRHLNNSAGASVQDYNGLHSNFPNFILGQQMKMTNDRLHSHQQEHDGIPNLRLPSFTAGPQMSLSKSFGVQALQQLSQSTERNNLKHQANDSSDAQQQVTPANSGGCNGAAKPRVRARRGQATDPHSIAERLRREKIAERMKNLQELVPNSNKTDKASMLDEIIDYVKFLQLQVKVLSMSRLGAAGAVVPLITDAQSEASGALHLSSIGQGGADLSEAQDNLAFEQEVVKLMESNVTTAMQYLQNKGLCLMPIALAAAISSQKGSSSAAVPPDRRKGADASHGAVSSHSLTERISRENGVHDGCNGGVIKQEEALRSA